MAGSLLICLLNGILRILRSAELLKKYLKGATAIPVEKRVKMLRLVEKMVMESADTISDIHGGGSPAAHRLTLLRESDTDYKKGCAKRLAGIE